jgi:hypothetical protein
MSIFNLFKPNLHAVEAETVARDIGGQIKIGKISPEELVINFERIASYNLQSYGIMDKFSKKIYKEICQLALLYSKGLTNQDKEIKDKLKLFKFPPNY